MSISKVLPFILGAAAALSACPAGAQPRLAAPVGPTVAQTGSAVYRFERFTIASRDGQRSYDVQVGIPKRRAPKHGFPVIDMLDGGAVIGALDERLLERLDAGGDPPVLVAIGYAGQPRFDVTARALDDTPPDPAKPHVTDDQGRPGGGAADFLKLIETRIQSRVKALAPIDRHRQTLWGHSYGGLFVIYAATRPHPRFQAFAAADPSFWWNYGSFLKEAQAFAARPGKPPRTLSIMIGLNEGHPSRPGGNGMRGSIPASATKLLADQFLASGHHIRFGACVGAGHGDMFRISLVRTLMGFIGKDDPSATLSCVVP